MKVGSSNFFVPKLPVFTGKPQESSLIPSSISDKLDINFAQSVDREAVGAGMVSGFVGAAVGAAVGRLAAGDAAGAAIGAIAGFALVGTGMFLINS